MITTAAVSKSAAFPKILIKFNVFSIEVRERRVAPPNDSRKYDKGYFREFLKLHQVVEKP